MTLGTSLDRFWTWQVKSRFSSRSKLWQLDCARGYDVAWTGDGPRSRPQPRPTLPRTCFGQVSGLQLVGNRKSRPDESSRVVKSSRDVPSVSRHEAGRNCSGYRPRPAVHWTGRGADSLR